MAYLPESDADRQRRLQEQGQGGQQISSGASGVITGGSQNTQAGQGSSKGPSRSGAFTNLNAYLNANKEQATQLGQNVASNVSNQAEQAKTQLSQTQDQFKNQADQNSVNRNQNLVNQAVSDPTKFVQDQNNVNEFTKIRDAQYKGPAGIQDVQNYGQASQQVNKANQAVENTKSEAGRFTLIQDQFKKPNYTRGQQKLDQLFLQNDTGSRSAFENVQQRYSGLMAQLNQAQTQSQEYAAARKAETEAARNDARTALGQLDDPSTPENEAAGAMGAFQTDLQGRTQAMRNKEQDAYNRLVAATSGTGDLELDADTMERLGLTEGQRLFNVDLSRVAPQYNPNSINDQTVASADDYAKYSALAKLAGIDPTYLSNRQLAGTAGGAQVDKDLLKRSIESAQTQFDELANNPNGIGDWAGWGPDQIAEFIRNDMLATPDLGGDSINTGLRQLSKKWLERYDSLQPNRTVKKKG